MAVTDTYRTSLKDVKREDHHSPTDSEEDASYLAGPDGTKLEPDMDDDSNAALISQTLNADGTPKRPMNAFMIFARRRRPQVAAENQSLRTGEVSKILSKEWTQMAISEKQFYLDQAKQLKDNFNLKYPDYVYRRRPNNSRRKRRSDSGTDHASHDDGHTPEYSDVSPVVDPSELEETRMLGSRQEHRYSSVSTGITPDADVRQSHSNVPPTHHSPSFPNSAIGDQRMPYMASPYDRPAHSMSSARTPDTEPSNSTFGYPSSSQSAFYPESGGMWPPGSDSRRASHQSWSPGADRGSGNNGQYLPTRGWPSNHPSPDAGAPGLPQQSTGPPPFPSLSPPFPPRHSGHPQAAFPADNGGGYAPHSPLSTTGGYGGPLSLPPPTGGGFARDPGGGYASSEYGVHGSYAGVPDDPHARGHHGFHNPGQTLPSLPPIRPSNYSPSMSSPVSAGGDGSQSMPYWRGDLPGRS
ncbi:hypothetical protein CONPUDRAFT_85076 [Coniophora puteana RWD-64-598 SS2]|uniref:HMG box domain-containing protein n=1 Tax=Coniophora puteana (strain RWD-64-598) TaxID=741705 RepID=A0A5M3MAE2_CONPW|nr:uncharacterized protein CONPUDRAFT_85076 [Coniophora puteana RWD-64-598 SS2]EIW75814.1 hypothetical protein CONPUDRAFT_85076 [Coniophora puteana RWD-64-598 SS2]